MKLVALSAVALSALAGCNNGQPRLYRVALDETPIRTIAVPSCFRNNNLPAGRGNITEQNYRSEKEWVIWQGNLNERNEQIEYLDIGTDSFELGNAPVVEVNSIIEGTDKTFSALRNEQKPIGNDYTEARQTQISVKFNDYSFSPTGTVALSAQYACIRGMIDCPTGMASPSDAASCSSNLNFVARRIEAQHITQFTNNAK